MTDTSAPNATQEFWEEFYQDRDQIWTGRPNALLVREVDALQPGTVLDLGCGEGGDAIWLARKGWQVTAVDVSATALRRGAAHATEAEVADNITWAEHDLMLSFPDGSFDLVSAQFFHSPVAQTEERAHVLRQAAGAVAPAGVLVIVGHGGWPSFITEPPHDVHFPTIPEVLADLDLGPNWKVETAEEVFSEVTHGEETGDRSDTVIRLRRQE